MKPYLRQYGFQPWLLFLLLFWSKLAFARSILVGGSLWESLIIELPVLIMTIIVVEWIWQNKPRLKHITYVLLDVLLSLILFALIVYFQYFNTLATYTSLFDLNQAGDVSDSIATLIKPHYYWLFADLPLLAVGIFVWMLMRKRGTMTSYTIRWRNRYGVAAMFIALIISLLNVLQAVGGGTLNEMVKARNMGLITYQAYAAYSDIKRMIVPNDQTITPRSIRNAKGISYLREAAWHGAAADKDVYVVQMESFNDFVIGLRVNGREVTPNLNALLEESFYWDRFFQQIGKGNTSDAEFVMNTSLYPLGTIAMSRQVAGYEVPSLPRLLDPHGYESVTLHTNDAVFWDRDKMYPALGFDAYYDKSFFGEEDFVHFGASDEVLYRKSIDVFKEIKSRGNRIYANLITMTNHSPFTLPEDKQLLKLPARLQDTFLGDFLMSVHYADHAFGVWIEEMQTHGLWDEAMVVIYGDHFGLAESAPPEDLAAAAELIGIPSYNKAEMFNVPLIIRVPGLEQGEIRHNVGGQIDILPTIMNLLGISYEDLIIFGQDLLNHESNLIGQRTYLPSGSFINDHVIFIPGAGIEDGTWIPIDHDDSAIASSAEHYADDYHRALRILGMSDAYIHNLPFQDAVPVVAVQP